MQNTFVWFGQDNRTSSCINCKLLLLCFTWAILYSGIIFLIITSEGRKITTFIVTTLSVISGFTLTLGIYDREWVHGQIQTETSYSRFTTNAIPGVLTVRLGLSHLNISYDSLDPSMEFFYNEHFKIDGDEWHNDDILRQEYIDALWRGTPNPVLEILEFMSCGGFGFIYRRAGFVTLFCLRISLVLWVLCQVLLLYVPKAVSKFLLLTGSLTLLAAFYYFYSIPTASFKMYIEGSRLNLGIGRTFYFVVIGGCINVILGLVFAIGGRCKTSFEVYYGTMFDFYENAAKIKYRYDNCEKLAENQAFTENWDDDLRVYRIGSKKFPPQNNNRCEVTYVNEGFLDSENCEKILTSDDENSIEINIDTPIKTYKQHQYINEAFEDANNDIETNVDNVFLVSRNRKITFNDEMEGNYKQTIILGHNDEFSLAEKERSIKCDGDLYVQTVLIKNIHNNPTSAKGNNSQKKKISIGEIDNKQRYINVIDFIDDDIHHKQNTVINDVGQKQTVLKSEKVLSNIFTLSKEAKQIMRRFDTPNENLI